VPWPSMLAGEAKGSLPCGCLTTGDEGPMPEPRASYAECPERFIEHLVCDVGEVFNLNTKRATEGPIR
jgi:hypothetical protein